MKTKIGLLTILSTMMFLAPTCAYAQEARLDHAILNQDGTFTMPNVNPHKDVLEIITPNKYYKEPQARLDHAILNQDGTFTMPNVNPHKDVLEIITPNKYYKEPQARLDHAILNPDGTFTMPNVDPHKDVLEIKTPNKHYIEPQAPINHTMTNSDTSIKEQNVKAHNNELEIQNEVQRNSFHKQVNNTENSRTARHLDIQEKNHTQNKNALPNTGVNETNLLQCLSLFTVGSFLLILKFYLKKMDTLKNKG
ncbi:hypothetical protein HYE69_06360 [Staphylococcus sp. GSSP0090]|nr:hypothetical protein [Staphylococcus sp. GSSP0090]